MLPSAAGFVDPLLSTGIPLTLLGVTRLAEIIEQDWKTERLEKRLQNYGAQANGELEATARLIASLYASMNNFPVFVSLTLLYFAAASYSEMARRLGKPHLAGSFLLCEDPVFGPECMRLLDRARRPLTEQESVELTSDILAAIKPFNVAGLDRHERRNWYPVDAEDLMNAAGKLGASRDEVIELLKRCGFQPELNSVDA